MFIISLLYIKDLSEVDAHLEGHNTYLQKHYATGQFLCSGPKIPRTGGIILCSAKSLNEVEQIVQEDPFVRHGMAEYTIIEFRAADYAPGFEKFLHNG